MLEWLCREVLISTSLTSRSERWVGVVVFFLKKKRKKYACVCLFVFYIFAYFSSSTYMYVRALINSPCVDNEWFQQAEGQAKSIESVYFEQNASVIASSPLRSLRLYTPFPCLSW